jgi:hypothetical protein
MVPNPLQVSIRDSPKPETTEPETPDHKTNETPSPVYASRMYKVISSGVGETPIVRAK